MIIKKRIMKITVIITIFLLVTLIFSFRLNKERPQELSPETKWLLPEDFNNQPAWGIKNGIIISTWPADLGGIGGGGPKGLFRIHKHGSKGLGWVNFISVDPITDLGNGWSEGESILFVPNPYERQNNPEQIITTKLPSDYNNIATITCPEPGVEQLNILFGIQEFNNKAKVYLTVHIRDDRPEEIEFRIFKHDNTTKIEMVRLSSTAGNFNHLRLLWLKDNVVDSKELYKEYQKQMTPKPGTKFSWKNSIMLFGPVTTFEYDTLQKDSQGNLIVAITRNLDDVEDYWNEYFTRYKLTQYFKKYRGYYTEKSFVSVNARYVFWHTLTPIPGGISYENFELNEPFHQGQRLWFGATEKTPEELGWKP
ncbi:MAG: hypothetical protein ACXQTP_05015 [Candidatus Methanofastidiosia archaeon]